MNSANRNVDALIICVTNIKAHISLLEKQKEVYYLHFLNFNLVFNKHRGQMLQYLALGIVRLCDALGRVQAVVRDRVQRCICILITA